MTHINQTHRNSMDANHNKIVLNFPSENSLESNEFSKEITSIDNELMPLEIEYCLPTISITNDNQTESLEQFAQNILNDILEHVAKSTPKSKPKKVPKMTFLPIDIDTNRFFLLNNGKKIRRCSSLKSQKSLLDDTGAKKIVRFADTLGLELINVQTYHSDTTNNLLLLQKPSATVATMTTNPKTLTSIHLAPLLNPLVTLQQFRDVIARHAVILETAQMTAAGTTIAGSVLVTNAPSDKLVHVRFRFSNDTWQSEQAHAQCVLDTACYAGAVDRWRFEFDMMGDDGDGGKVQRIEIAAELKLEGMEAVLVDDNDKQYYVFDVVRVDDGCSDNRDTNAEDTIVNESMREEMQMRMRKMPLESHDNNTVNADVITVSGFIVICILVFYIQKFVFLVT